jgi:hypothetical protein
MNGDHIGYERDDPSEKKTKTGTLNSSPAPDYPRLHCRLLTMPPRAPVAIRDRGVVSRHLDLLFR